MIGRTNAVSKPGVELSLVVSVTSGAAVTATKGSKTVNGTAAGGSCVLSLPEAGTWSVKATLNGQTSDTKSVSVVDSYAVALTFFSATITVNVDSRRIRHAEKGRDDNRHKDEQRDGGFHRHGDGSVHGHGHKERADDERLGQRRFRHDLLRADALFRELHAQQ